jgi:hypothetical protein
MKQNKLNKKLTLTKKTIMNMPTQDMEKVRGGVDTLVLTVYDCVDTNGDGIFTRRSCN